MACVSCFDARIADLFYRDLNWEPRDPRFRRESVFHLIDNNSPKLLVGAYIMFLFLMVMAFQAQKQGFNLLSAAPDAGNGFLIRYATAVMLAFMFVYWISLSYTSARPIMTQGTVDEYDRMLPVLTTDRAFVRSRWGRINGWRSQNNGYFDPLLTMMLVAFLTLAMQRYAALSSGIPLTVSGLRFLIVMSLLPAMAIVWERMVSGAMWASDLVLVILVCFAAVLGAAAIYRWLVQAVNYFGARNVRYDQWGGLPQEERYRHFARDYLIYLASAGGLTLLGYAAYSTIYGVHVNGDEYLVPDMTRTDNYTVYVGDKAIETEYKRTSSRGSQKPSGVKPDELRIRCSNGKTVTVLPGSFYADGEVAAQVKKGCSSEN